MAKNDNNQSFMFKLATFIVDKRNLFFLITVIGLIFSLFSRNWVEVENSLASYLPDYSETRQALDIMEEQFTTFGSARIMISNISCEDAEALLSDLEDIEGVQSIEFDDSVEHYTNVNAMYSVTFGYDEEDDRCLASLEAVKDALGAYDVFVDTDLGNTLQDTIAKEVSIIMVYVAVIVVVVLLLTSDTFAEVPVLLLTFVNAMLLNSGTNFIFGKISFVSNSVTSILQLALSLDYAVIFCNRFKEEHKVLPTREAVIVSLSKAIPEIGASSLTTVGGLVAMIFMSFKIGPDMGICLIKAIFHALLSVFTLMPGLLVIFSPLMEKTRHKSFVPEIPFVGKLAFNTKVIVPPAFLLILVGAIVLSGKCPYAYGYTGMKTPKLNETQIAENWIEDNFPSKNLMAVIVPAGDYETEKKLLSELEGMDQVDSALGLANVEALDGYMLTDRLTPRQFSELIDLDYEVCELLFAAYAAEDESYGKIVGGLSTYSVPLIDMFMFLHDAVEEGYVSLDEDLTEELDSAYEQMSNAEIQLQGEDYSRMLVYVNLPEGGDETYEFVDTMRSTAQKYYPEGTVLVAGNSTNEYDFQKAFSRDNMVVSIVSILIVLVVLLFTFDSVGMPLLLILVIQGSIWINFSFPILTGSKLFFMSYLVVSSIQMGANIDYAIVIASRFQDVKSELSYREAIIETMNFAFPTIITSGSILAVAGGLIGQMTSEVTIAGIGQSLCRGTIISIILVMFVLPQILLLGDKVVSKTSFSVPRAILKRNTTGLTRLDGVIRGEINGTISGIVHAVVEGDVNVNIVSGEFLQDSVKPAAGSMEGGLNNEDDK